MLLGFWFNRFQWGMVAKHSINPKKVLCANTLTTAQITALPEEVDGKSRVEAEQTLISNLYLCLEKKGRTIPQEKTTFGFDFDNIIESHSCFGNGVEERTQRDIRNF